MKVAPIIPIHMAAHRAGNLTRRTMDSLPFDRLLEQFQSKHRTLDFCILATEGPRPGHRFVLIANFRPMPADVAGLSVQLLPLGRVLEMLVDDVVEQFADRNKGSVINEINTIGIQVDREHQVRADDQVRNAKLWRNWSLEPQVAIILQFHSSDGGYIGEAQQNIDVAGHRILRRKDTYSPKRNISIVEDWTMSQRHMRCDARI